MGSLAIPSDPQEQGSAEDPPSATGRGSHKPRLPKGSLKLAAVLDLHPEVEIRDQVCADLGCNVGGFTRELLRRGARLVHAVDSGYGVLEWDLRQDPRVDTRERKNALHLDLSDLDIVVIDTAWTLQEIILPRARSYLRPGGAIFSLLKPDYELPRGRPGRPRRVLDETESQSVARAVHARCETVLGCPLRLYPSPCRGGSGAREWWLVLISRE